MPTKKKKAVARITKVEELSYEEAQVIMLCKDGADVSHYDYAGHLRAIQRRGLPVWDIKDPRKKPKQPQGSLFTICQPMGRYKITEKEPYFGCKATSLGITLAAARLTYPVDLEAYHADLKRRIKLDQTNQAKARKAGR